MTQLVEKVEDLVPNIPKLRLWIRALESGEYTQGTGSLAHLGPDKKARYCCLGVACELAIKDGLELSRHEGTVQEEPFIYGETDDRDVERHMDGQSTVQLPAKVAHWLGLNEVDVLLVPAGQHSCAPGGCPGGLTAVGANDAHHMTFPQIAALLRARYNVWEDKYGNEG